MEEWTLEIIQIYQRNCHSGQSKWDFDHWTRLSLRGPHHKVCTVQVKILVTLVTGPPFLYMLNPFVTELTHHPRTNPVQEIS